MSSDFSVMPEIVLEGRRVINNITRAASLFLTKTLFSFLLGILTLFLSNGTYPFEPIQLTLISSLTVGIPGFFLALEPSEERVRGSFLKTVLYRALPGGIAVALCAALSMLIADRAMSSTLATLTGGVIGFVVLLRTCLPLNNRRIVLLAAVAAAFAGAAIIPFTAGIFLLQALNGAAFIKFALLAALGCAIVLVSAEVLKKRQRENETLR